MYNTILVPHGGAPAEDEALKHAFYAARDSSRIIILHIVEALSHPPTFALSSSERTSLLKKIDEVNEETRQGMEKMMEKYAQQCKENNLKSKIQVVIGDASEIILDTVEKEKVDLIVMSKRRKLKGIKKLLSLGSVSRKIVENTSCPVLLIDAENK
ncbi:universal stress protein [Nitrosopumilus sp.]|uniref:universal stress protein n=1 Tax=Nitrosopumilus sp. TaxID=2024843 RepID=UPI0034A06C0C